MELSKSASFVFLPCSKIVIFVGVDEDARFVELILVENAIVVCAWGEVELSLADEGEFTVILFCFTSVETDLIKLFSFYMNFHEILIIYFIDICSLVTHTNFFNV